MSMFKKATKAKAKLRAAICGPAGSGKTFTALALASSLVEGGKIAVIDTERGSASKYSDMFSFDTLELETFHPQLYIDAIHAAEDGGYDVLVIDSLSHAWAGKGGVLDQADAIAKRMKTSNSFTAWKEATPLQQSLIDTILQCKLHVICTMRSKMEYVLESIERNGRTIQQPKRVGMAPVQRDDVQYEFDVVGEMDSENNMSIVKTRCAALAGDVIRKPGKQLAKILRDWLSDGTEPEQPKAAPHVPPETKAHEEILTGDNPPRVGDQPPVTTASTETKKDEPSGHGGGGWTQHNAIKVREALSAVSVKIGTTVGDEAVKEWIHKKWGYASRRQLTPPQVDEVLSWLRESFRQGKVL